MNKALQNKDLIFLSFVIILPKKDKIMSISPLSKSNAISSETVNNPSEKPNPTSTKTDSVAIQSIQKFSSKRGLKRSMQSLNSVSPATKESDSKSSEKDHIEAIQRAIARVRDMEASSFKDFFGSEDIFTTRKEREELAHKASSSSSENTNKIKRRKTNEENRSELDNSIQKSAHEILSASTLPSLDDLSGSYKSIRDEKGNHIGLVISVTRFSNPSTKTSSSSLSLKQRKPEVSRALKSLKATIRKKQSSAKKETIKKARKQNVPQKDHYISLESSHGQSSRATKSKHKDKSKQ
jgi:hypothetical protein